jgi:hypothetical protein
MVVITNPTRFGYTPCDVFFGEVRERPERNMIIAGSNDCLLVDPSGNVVEFVAREGSKIITKPA